MTTVIKTAALSTALDITDITTIAIDGDGVFDKLLTLHRLMLTREFKDGRIVGKEYSDTFTKTYIANLELAIRLTMEKEKQAYDIELQEAQIRKMDAETDIAYKQLELITLKLPFEISLIEAQVAKMEADATVAEKQILLAEKELLIKEKELALLEEQVILTAQKVITEKAQTDPSVIGDGSVISMNNKVLAAQVEGFKRSAEQQAANTLLQTWIVRLNNDAALTNDANMLKDNYIGRAVATMMEGVGMSVAGQDESDI
jgi:hypothetical protein